jgi:uncharacterized protein YlxW (UPF0749 family)
MGTKRAGFWIFLLVAGILLGLLARSIMQTYTGGPAFLAVGVGNEALQRQVDEYAAELKDLRAENESLTRQILTGEISTERTKPELDAARNAAGMLSATGPGVTIALADAQSSDGLMVERGLVHDYDLLYIINELRAAGAEAIAIGSGKVMERITGESFIRCTGPTVIVNGSRMTAPFTLEAIGDPDILKRALEMKGGVLEQLRAYGLQVSVAQAMRLELPAYDLPLRYHYVGVPAPEEKAEKPQPEAVEVRRGTK